LLTIVLVTALVVNVFLVVAYRQRNMQSYLAAFIDKQKLLENTISPKVILAGGSSVAFGFDSETLSEEIGMPVVNMGLQGGLGIRFVLESIRPYLHNGDILILSPEYHNIFSQLSGGELLAQMLVVDPQGIRYLSSVREFAEVIKAFPAMHTEAIKNMAEDLKLHDCYLCQNHEMIYYRGAFDPKTGDILSNDDQSYPRSEQVLILQFSSDSKDLGKNIDYFNRYYRSIVPEGIAMYFLYPSTVKTTSPDTSLLLQRLSSTLQGALEFPILGTPFDTQFANQFMFDTPYHLNQEGDVLRTQQVVDWLCQAEIDLSCHPR
jgi:hypothetical protein